MATTTHSPLSALDAETILMESNWLAGRLASYGWDNATRARVCESIAKTLDGDDWRFDRLRKIEQRNGFDFSGADRILDVGCGRGELVLGARQLGINMVGLELDRTCLQASRAFAERVGLSNAEWSAAMHRGDVADLPFDSHSFAAINCSQVVEHVTDPVVVARELFRCLKPGGILSLDAPEYRGVFEAHYRIPWLPFLLFHLAHAWLDVFNKPHAGLGTFSYVSLPHVRGILEAVGFEILSATTSTPMTQLEIENQLLHRVVGDVFPHTEDAVRTAATLAQSADLQATETSMILLARKPESIAQ